MVDECDLFVGLLWERWGQPSGEYTSGFEEEYQRARARRKAHDKPEIWLIFKDVDPTRLKDPGEQLKRVIEFRDSQMALREVLFQRVRNADDWKAKFHNWLFEHIVKLASPLQASQQEPAGVVTVSDSAQASAIESASQGGDLDAIPQQLRALSALLGKALQTGELEFFATQKNPLDESDVARLYLLSATLMSHRYTREVLGAHEINLLYKHREQLDATSIEMHQLFRTIIRDAGDVKPGWFWFPGTEEDWVRKILLELATRDYSDEVRARALELLTAARIEIPRELFPALLGHDSEVVRQSAFAWLAAQGDESTLSALEGLAEDDEPMLSSAAQEARSQILTRLDPRTAFSEVIARGEYISDDKRRALRARISEVDDQTLLKATESSWDHVRQMSLEELVRRGSLPVSLANKFTTDPSLAVRAIAFRSLAAQGALPDFETVRRALKGDDEESQPKGGRLLGLYLLGERQAEPSPDLDSILVTSYCTKSTEDLLAAVDWFSVNGHLAYRALALDRFDSFSSHLRSDMADGFKRIKEESSQRREKKIGLEQWTTISASFEKYDEFIRSQFARAALLGLAKNGQPSDAELVRPYLAQTDSSLRDIAVSVISRVGDSKDAGALLKIAKESYGGVKQEAAAGALKLSSSPLEVARELMLSNSPEVVRVAFDWMFTQDSRDVREIFDELRDDASDTNRVRALYYLSKRLQRAELEELLNGYLRKGSYYYNVVTWLDRLLYAPPPLRDMFVRDLEQKAS
jgi:HEAT repeat protein